MGPPVRLKVDFQLPQCRERVVPRELFLESRQVAALATKAAAGNAESFQQAHAFATDDPASADRFVFIEVIPAYGGLASVAAHLTITDGPLGGSITSQSANLAIDFPSCRGSSSRPGGNYASSRCCGRGRKYGSAGRSRIVRRPVCRLRIIAGRQFAMIDAVARSP